MAVSFIGGGGGGGVTGLPRESDRPLKSLINLIT